MKSVFEKIKIGDLNKSLSVKVRDSSDRYDFVFNLSGFVPSIWADIFEDKKQFSSYNTKPKASVEGNILNVQCTKDQLENGNLRELERIFEETNIKYLSYLENEIKKEEYQIKEKVKENIDLENLNNRLKNKAK